MTPITDAIAQLQAQLRAQPRQVRIGAAVGAVVVAYLLAVVLLPAGLPFGVALLGVVLGGLDAMVAMGLVLVYRSARILNFAQAEIGGLAATMAVVLIIGHGVPYLVAVPIGLAVAVGTGALIDATVVRRFFTAPRLILTVATVGLAQLLGAFELGLPSLLAKHVNTRARFTFPVHVTLNVGPIVFTGDHLVALAVVPSVLAALAWFFGRSDTGIAVRAAADSNERALLLGIPVRKLSRATWMVAAGLSGIGSLLSAPILGPQLGSIAGPTVLLAPLAAAVLARMESLPKTVAAAIGIGVIQQAVFWSYPRSSTVDLILFLLVLGALTTQRKAGGRVADGGLGGYVAVKEVRPVPAVLARLPEVWITKVVVGLTAAVLALWIPSILSTSKVTLLAYIAIYGMLAVSLVILSGWSGQVSLGQFAFAGAGGAACATLLVHQHLDVFIALIVAALVGGIAALLVGVPALRIPGLFLAVTTLGFGVPVATFLLDRTRFPTLNPERLARPMLLGRVDLGAPLTFCYVCMGGFVLCYALARNLRRARAGRVIVAVRDNERAAAAFSIEPVRTKLTAFALSGGMAGIAGAFYVIGLRGVPFNGFSPVASLQVFTMVVIGGLGSLPGALLGAAYVEGAQYGLRGASQLLATGAGLLFLLMVFPGGLGSLMFAGRDKALTALANRRGLRVPSFTERPDAAGSDEPGSPTPVLSAAHSVEHVTEADDLRPEAAVVLRNIDAGYGPVQVLFDVDLHVDNGEVVALLGTNGAGKSTILRVLAGLMDPGPGRVVLEGIDVTGLDAIGRVKAGLVTVPGGRGIFGSLTVADNLRLGGWLHRKDPAFLEATNKRVLELFPRLAERLDSQASLLSGGEQQMLTIAQALLCKPKVLLIDELSLGLAPTVVATLLDVVRRINAEGVSVVVVEQSVNVALELAQRAVFMERGAVQFSGPTAELAERPDLLRSVFLPGGGSASEDADVAAKPAARPARAPVPADAPVVFELAGIGRSYGGIVAVADVDMPVRAGQILGVIGSNGAGKTTMFDLASGFVVPDTGEVLLDGKDVTTLRPAERAEVGLGRTFQDARLFPNTTVAETLSIAVERHVDVREPFACAVRLGAAVASERAVAARVDALLDTLGLGRYRNAFIAELSTGTRRVVELACALAHEPHVLLLDEPCAGIAQAEGEALAALLLRIRADLDATLVIVEHDIPLVTSIADELVCMHLGRVIARGEPASVLAEPSVVASYLGTDEAAINRSGGRAPATRRPRRARPAATAEA